MKETVPVLESAISKQEAEIERCRRKIECLERENEKVREENEFLHLELTKQNLKYEEKISLMQAELADIKIAVQERGLDYDDDDEKLIESPERNCTIATTTALKNETENRKDEILLEPSSRLTTGLRSAAPRVPKPPPTPSLSILSNLPSSSSSEVSSIIPTPPPPVAKTAAPPLCRVSTVGPPPPPPPPPRKGLKPFPGKVTRVPEVVEFYHSLMKRDGNCRRDGNSNGGGAATAKDMIGEIENRSAHLLAIKTDVETQGDFIRFLIKEVEAAAFTDIEDVVPFVNWLDGELSYLVDERAVLKHFSWPEKKADALREAAFEYCDLKKLESEVSSFRNDPRQPCGHALKKMQSLYEKLEHGVYNLSRMRESAAERYRGFKIPVNWMMDTGYISQIKLASVKLAMKYMKRVSAELEMVTGGPEEEDLIVQGVKFAFRVHQFASGFDVETMRAFQELRDKARTFNQKIAS